MEKENSKGKIKITKESLKCNEKIDYSKLEKDLQTWLKNKRNLDFVRGKKFK